MSQYEDLLVDALLDCGFSLDEAMRLIELQERVDRKRREREVKRSHWLTPGDDRRNMWN